MKERILLMGAPNAGKTTLYNWLTESRYKTVNYPGATVEIAEGETSARFGAPLFACDTPGTYSLFPKSYDEKIAIDSAFCHPVYGQASVVVSVVDATQLSRHLFLTYQLKETGIRQIVALTNIDLLAERGQKVDLRLLSTQLDLPIIPINGQTGEGVAELVKTMRDVLNSTPTVVKPLDRWNKEKSEQIFDAISRLSRSVLSEAGSSQNDAYARTQKVDRVLMHPFWGLIIFVFFMTALFTAIFWAATPFMDYIDTGFGWLAERVTEWLPQSLLGDFLSNGVIAGVGSVLIFLPQIVILFLGICYFEDSGYMARAATLVDRPLAKIGLNGRSFIPLLSGYACAIPAMMAARTISSRRERLLTLFVVPLMSCSARLPVYALLLAFLFREQPAWKGGLALAGIYFLSLLVGAVASTLASKLLKITDKSFFLLELPVYRRPKLTAVLRQTFSRASSYVMKAGPIIFVLALVIWAACTFPHFRAEDPTDRLNESYAAQLGHMIEPLMEPMGFDWRVGVGLISAFAAREVFVSSMAVVFHITETDSEEGLTDSLLKTMSEATAPDGLPLFTVSSVLGLIIFFMIALQCLSTVGVAKREFGSWKWALGQLAIFNVVAYLLAVAIVQGLRAFGIT